MVIAFMIRNTKYDRDLDKEYMVKAAMMIKFVELTQWPESIEAKDPKVIQFCVVGTNPFTTKARRVFTEAGHAGRRYRLVKGHAYRKQFCHIVFIGGCDERKIHRVVSELKSTPTLLVGDLSGFAQMGGDIELARVVKSDKDQRIKLILNEQAALEKGLVFDPRMKESGVATVIHKSH